MDDSFLLTYYFLLYFCDKFWEFSLTEVKRKRSEVSKQTMNWNNESLLPMYYYLKNKITFSAWSVKTSQNVRKLPRYSTFSSIADFEERKIPITNDNLPISNRIPVTPHEINNLLFRHDRALRILKKRSQRRQQSSNQNEMPQVSPAMTRSKRCHENRQKNNTYIFRLRARRTFLIKWAIGCTLRSENKGNDKGRCCVTPKKTSSASVKQS